ncbi:hypothetical protein E1A91_D06G073200v1 [Gossypium mustelinum]|uniref:Uncharacterized protein n=1 Tax=Gossypium mustelinum TaxID=34275 RepID=A0A5D2UIL3_GOSMU|nr:hypothetical protein E1A91_D06G073200v1 [Gossypium mustelinum]
MRLIYFWLFSFSYSQLFSSLCSACLLLHTASHFACLWQILTLPFQHLLLQKPSADHYHHYQMYLLAFHHLQLIARVGHYPVVHKYPTDLYNTISSSYSIY